MRPITSIERNDFCHTPGRKYIYRGQPYRLR